MKVHYKPVIMTRLDKTIDDAARRDIEIDFIELTNMELATLRHELEERYAVSKHKAKYRGVRQLEYRGVSIVQESEFTNMQGAHPFSGANMPSNRYNPCGEINKPEF